MDREADALIKQADQLLGELELHLHAKGAEIAELRAARISRDVIAAFYPYDLDDWGDRLAQCSRDSWSLDFPLTDEDWKAAEAFAKQLPPIAPTLSAKEQKIYRHLTRGSDSAWCSMHVGLIVMALYLLTREPAARQALNSENLAQGAQLLEQARAVLTCIPSVPE